MGLKTNLTKEDIRLIRAAAIERDRLRAELDQLTNRALTEKFGTTHATISNVINHTCTYRNAL